MILIRVRQKTVDLAAGIGPHETTVFGEQDSRAGETSKFVEQLRFELLLPAAGFPTSLWATIQSLQSDTTGSPCSALFVCTTASAQADAAAIEAAARERKFLRVFPREASLLPEEAIGTASDQNEILVDRPQSCQR
uniref:hypothetical protein n=1 Tax=Neorhizobium sp. EC2-8 TaxID=3129230 RepID=UPI0031019476